MPRACSICTHARRFEIEELLATRRGTYRGIARSFAVSEDAVSRHVKSGHVGQLLALAADAERAAAADSLLDRIEGLQSQTLAILDSAEDQRTALSAIAQARRNLELIGEVTKELDRAGTINLELSPEWVEIKAVLVTTLERFPDARDAVLSALEEEVPNGKP